jgi:hypothetical protein
LRFAKAKREDQVNEREEGYRRNREGTRKMAFGIIDGVEHAEGGNRNECSDSENAMRELDANETTQIAGDLGAGLCGLRGRGNGRGRRRGHARGARGHGVGSSGSFLLA